MSIEERVLTDEELLNDPEAIVNGIIICSKKWEICTIPGMWLYAESFCINCEGYNPNCKYYEPTVLE